MAMIDSHNPEMSREPLAGDVAYQVFVDRRDGLGPVLDGCWGSEHALFSSFEDARGAAEQLSTLCHNPPLFVVYRVTFDDDLEMRIVD